jgi:hypothetical protein
MFAAPRVHASKHLRVLESHCGLADRTPDSWARRRPVEAKEVTKELSLVGPRRAASVPRGTKGANGYVDVTAQAY